MATAKASTKTEKPILKALHVTMENRPGALAKVTRALADGKINIEAVEAEILGRSGFFRFYTQTPVEAEKILRSQGLITMGMDVLEVVLSNKPGELARMCETLSKAGINIESAFGSGHGPNKEATFYLRVDKPQDAHKILNGADFQARRTDR
jgi:hypothetical protein